MRFNRPSPATAIALVALVIAAGGGDAIAAGTAAAVKAISGKKIKKNSIEADRLTAKARKALKGQTGAPGLPGVAGPTGPSGPTGPTGTVDTSKFYDKGTSDTRFLLATGKAVDADKLDGLDSSAFLGANAKAADADKLDGLDSSAFLGAGAKAADAETVDGINGAEIAKRGIAQVVLDARGWEPFTSGDPVTATRFNSTYRVTRSATGSNFFVLPAVLPNAFNGERLSLESVRYCYSASASVVLDSFQVVMVSHANSGIGVQLDTTIDGTDRTDSACRTLTPTSPAALDGTNTPAILATASWVAANQELHLGAVTLNLVPTTIAARTPARTAQGDGTSEPSPGVGSP